MREQHTQKSQEGKTNSVSGYIRDQRVAEVSAGCRVLPRVFHCPNNARMVFWFILITCH